MSTGLPHSESMLLFVILGKKKSANLHRLMALAQYSGMFPRVGAERR